ncbi:hypothetical protein V5799_000643 [Amblyomma americanum]|uniref:Cytochrome n=1 Tax=Amblyomma americanum TaxID=6943 RepID=A0AAQ4D2H2_AMBAM
MYRPDDFLFRYLDMKGIGGLNGEEWQANRRYCFQVMRNLGFAKKPMEQHMQEEVQCFNEILESSKGQPITICHQLGASIVNNISALVFGQRYELGDTTGRFVEALLRKFMLNATFFSVFDFLPIVRFLAYYIPHTRIYSVRSVFKDFKQFVRAKYDTTIGGYHIPAGTLVIPNFWKLHNDPTHWPDPSKYDPSRFLNADGTEMKEKPLAFLPFSLGKRSCPGETLAIMEIFIYVTTVLQKFRVHPEEGKSISLKPYDALMTVVDDTQKLCFTPR